MKESSKTWFSPLFVKMVNSMSSGSMYSMSSSGEEARLEDGFVAFLNLKR